MKKLFKWITGFTGGAVVGISLALIITASSIAYATKSDVSLKGIWDSMANIATYAVQEANEVWHIKASNTVVWEGATANDFENTVTVVDPTADQTLSYPALAAGTSYGICVADGNTFSLQQANGCWFGNNGVFCEGATANNFETKFSVVDGTTDVTVSIPALATTTSTAGVSLTDGNTFSLQQANGSWAGNNGYFFEMATADGNELKLAPMGDNTSADKTVLIPTTTASALMVSVLTTNDVNVANSIWGVSNGLAMGGATGANGLEITVSPFDPQVDSTAVVGNWTGSVVMMIADTGTASGHTLIDGATATNCTVTIEDDTLIAGGVLTVQAMGTFAGASNPGEVFLAIDGTTIVKVVQATAGADDWVVDCTMYNVTAATQEANCVLSVDTDAAVVVTRAVDTTDFAGGNVVVGIYIASGNGSDTTTLESCQIFAAP